MTTERHRDRGLGVATAAFACNVVFGTYVSIRDDLRGEPFGITIPLSVPAGIVIGWGAGVAAPWPMPVAALLAGARASRPESTSRPALVCAAIGIGGFAGLLMEPNTCRPKSWTLPTLISIAMGFATTALLASRAISHVHGHRATAGVNAELPETELAKTG